MRVALLLVAMLLSSPAVGQDDAPPEPEAVEADEGTDDADEGTDDADEGTDDADEGTDDADEGTDDAELAAPTDNEPKDATEAVQTASALVQAFHDRNWTLVFALAVMLLVFAVRRFGLLDKLPRDAVVWVSVALAVLASVASALIEGLPTVEAILNGAVAGLTGAGLWTAAGKHLLAGKKKEEAAE